MREVYRCREDEHFKLIKDTPRSIVDNNILISCPDFDHSLRFQPLTIWFWVKHKSVLLIVNEVL